MILRRNSIQGWPLASILIHIHKHTVVDTPRLAVQASVITDHLTYAELSVCHCCMENFPSDWRVRVSWPYFDLHFSSPCSLCVCPTCIHRLPWAFPQLPSRCTFSTDILQTTRLLQASSSSSLSLHHALSGISALTFQVLSYYTWILLVFDELCGDVQSSTMTYVCLCIYLVPHMVLYSWLVPIILAKVTL